MSRVVAADVVEIKPGMNIYTLLVFVALVAEAIAFLALYMKSTEIFLQNSNLFN